MAPVSLFIKESKDYKRVFKEGRKTVSPHFVFYRAIGACKYSRLGIAVPKAAIPLATGRNRLKRRIREVWRARNHYGHKILDCVIVIRKSTDRLTSEAFYREITNILNKNLP